jgi:hypothetical protein
MVTVKVMCENHHMVRVINLTEQHFSCGRAVAAISQAHCWLGIYTRPLCVILYALAARPQMREELKYSFTNISQISSDQDVWSQNFFSSLKAGIQANFVQIFRASSRI